MPFDNKGHFSRLHKWEDDRKNKIGIMSERHDEEDDNFSEGLSNCLLKDGRSSMTGNLNVGNFQIKNLAEGTADADAVNLSQLNQVQNNAAAELKSIVNRLIPIGTIAPMLFDDNHDNWLLCNGQAISRTSYSDLFAVIGTRFGSGDGISTFNLPDYRGKFLRGLGGNSATDIYTTQAEGLPNITGQAKSAYGVNNVTANSGALAATIYTGGSASGQQDGGDGTDGEKMQSSNISFNAQNSNSIYGASAHVTPINQAINFFVKAKGE